MQVRTLRLVQLPIRPLWLPGIWSHPLIRPVHTHSHPRAAVELLRGELELSMALLGCKAVGEVTADFVIPPSEGPLRIPRSRL